MTQTQPTPPATTRTLTDRIPRGAAARDPDALYGTFANWVETQDISLYDHQSEALIAILIFSLGVLGIVGLQATMIKNTSEAKYRAEASYLAQQRIGEMWATPTNLAAFLETDADISATTPLPTARRTVTQTATGAYVVTITWQLPGEAQRNFTTSANITGF